MAEGLISGARISIHEAEIALAAMDKRVSLANAAALKKVVAKTATTIKGGMRGRPRWDHRGASQRTGPAVTLGLSPRHVSKSGGPGKLTGALSSSIRKSKKPRAVPGGFTAVVMSGGAGGPQNLYKGRVEANQPYFKPGVDKAAPKLPAIWEAAYAKATRT